MAAGYVALGSPEATALLGALLAGERVHMEASPPPKQTPAKTRRAKSAAQKTAGHVALVTVDGERIASAPTDVTPRARLDVARATLKAFKTHKTTIPVDAALRRLAHLYRDHPDLQTEAYKTVKSFVLIAGGNRPARLRRLSQRGKSPLVKHGIWERLVKDVKALNAERPPKAARPGRRLHKRRPGDRH